MIYDLIIIGIGVSGTFALTNLSDNINILAIDRNNDILSKFMVSGKGKSNITNTLPIEEFLKNIIDNNKFLYSSLTKYNSTNILDFLNKLGIQYHEKSKNRIHLIDSNEIFRKKIKDLISKRKNTKIKLNTNVENIKKNKNIFFIKTNNGEFKSTNVLISSGGLSYKNFGCDDTCVKIAKSFGHTIKDQYPIGIGLNANFEKKLQGISQEDVNISVIVNEKVIYNEYGSIMITHYGFGGPVIRRVSGYVTKAMLNNDKTEIEIQWIDRAQAETDLKKNKNISQCFKQLNKSIKSYLTKEFKDLDLKNTSKKTKEMILNKICSDRYIITSHQGFTTAINTGGGIDVKELNPKTYESKLVNGLYFIGEIIDINPRTNGFNITVCYSTSMMFSDNFNDKIINNKGEKDELFK